jgi:hypothetical protein
MRLFCLLTSANALILRYYLSWGGRRKWLIRDLRIYLNGFWNRGIGAKTRKDSQKVAGEKYGGPPFTTVALTTPARLRGLSGR